MTLAYVTRPLSDRTWLRRESERDQSPFRVGWAQILGVQ